MTATAKTVAPFTVACSAARRTAMKAWLAPAAGEKTGCAVLSRFAICFATLTLAACGTRSFVMPASNGNLVVSGSSAELTSGSQEKARLVKDADAYCERREKSAVVVASSATDAKRGTLGAPGSLTRATVEFRCE